MKETEKTLTKKSLKHEAKGDKLFNKGKYREALEEYQKGEAFNQKRPELYQKLIETLNRLEGEWREEDFSNSMNWTMRKQELENPQIKLVHETFSVEYKEVQTLVQRLLLAPGAEAENALIEKILSFGEKASLPMLHFLLSMKALMTQGTATKEQREKTS